MKDNKIVTMKKHNSTNYINLPSKYVKDRDFKDGDNFILFYNCDKRIIQLMKIEVDDDIHK